MNGSSAAIYNSAGSPSSPTKDLRPHVNSFFLLSCGKHFWNHWFLRYIPLSWPAATNSLMSLRWIPWDFARYWIRACHARHPSQRAFDTYRLSIRFQNMAVSQILLRPFGSWQRTCFAPNVHGYSQESYLVYLPPDQQDSSCTVER